MIYLPHLFWNFVVTASCTMPTNLSLEQLLAFRNFSLIETKQYLSLSEEQIQENAVYQKLTGLRVLHNPEVHPGKFFFRDNEFILLYISGTSNLSHLDAVKLLECLGQHEAVLPARVGDFTMHLVYPNLGIAFSLEGSRLWILEIFPPMSLEEYKSTIYEERPAHVRRPMW